MALEEKEDAPYKRDMENPRLVDRTEWGAAQPKSVKLLNGGPTYMVATWTGTEKCKSEKECSPILKRLQVTSMKDGLPDIKYNFLIDSDGNIYEGRGWDISTNVSEGEDGNLTYLDDKSVYVAFIGPKDELPNPFMLLALAGLSHIGIEKGHMNRDLKFVKIHKKNVESFDRTFEQKPNGLTQEEQEKLNALEQGIDNDDDDDGSDDDEG